MDKRVASADAAVARIEDGSTILMGGFGLAGIPENLIEALRRKGTKDLTVVSNNAGQDGFGIALLFEKKQIRKMIASYVGENKIFERLALSKEIEVELNPQGTLAERIRCGGAGIPAFFTPTGYGTMAAEGKEVRDFNGSPQILVPSVRGNYAFVKAWKGDRWGNLVFRKTARNYNAVMATAADHTIAEVEEFVELGTLNPDCIHTPGIFVDAIFQGSNYSRRIEHRTVRARGASEMASANGKREFIAKRVAQDLHDGMYVNLGIGLPTLVANYLVPGMDVVLQSENGMLGTGPYPWDGEEDADLINAGKETISEIPGCSYFSSAESFGMIRGGRIDVSILGAMQVDEKGNLANWAIPGKMIKGMGGAMDLVSRAKRVVIAMEHTSKGGEHKIVKQCSLPLTGVGVVKLIVTELAVIEVTPQGLLLREVAAGATPESVQSFTEPKLKIAPDLKTIAV
jgi:3-oxoacid CoA-transferase